LYFFLTTLYFFSLLYQQVFTSAPLSAPLAITGELDVELYVSTANVNDTDFAVRLTDVHPDGKTSQLVQDGENAFSSCSVFSIFLFSMNQ